MTRSRRVDPAFYIATARFLESCLRTEGSLFTPGRAVWSKDCVGELYRRLGENREEAKGTDFAHKLRGPLQGASQEVVQLAAEVLYVLLLPQDSRLATKREHIVTLLGLCERPVALPDELSEALAYGFASYGPAASQRFNQFIFLVEFAHAWTTREQEQREAILLDPDRFRELVFSLPRKAASAQVEGLLHMVFPEHFEPIVSVDVKRKILEAFREHSPDCSLSIDRRIAQIRVELSREYGEGFSFLDAPLRAHWEQELRASSQDERAWLVRAPTNSATSTLPQWFEEESVSLAWPSLERLDLGASEAQIREELARASPESPPGQIRRSAGIVKRFLAIADGELILTPDADALYVARATGAVSWSEGPDTLSLCRPVEWLNRDSPASRAQLKGSNPNLYSRLQTLLSVCDLKEDIEAIRKLAVLAPPPASTEPPEPPHPQSAPVAEPPTPLPVELGLPAASEQLARSLHLPRAWLQQALDLLYEKRQLIFYGPPGAGKSFVAQALGEHIRGAGGDWQLVQFHPAYSYEDFFEGYRPSKPEDGGALRFDLRAGPLRLLAEQARLNPGRAYLLVIDEINRGNIAKIFGELYFLLEYRDRPIRLQYSPEEPFELPENLFLIGTMNTADRSIALVDSALRRRFYFDPFLPAESPVGEVLKSWLTARGYDTEPARLLAALNDALAQALPDEDFAIGPSYLMPKDGQPNLERVWRHAIGPLLEERFYGIRRPAELQSEFGLEAIRARLHAPEGPPIEDGRHLPEEELAA